MTGKHMLFLAFHYLSPRLTLSVLAFIIIGDKAPVRTYTTLVVFPHRQPLFQFRV